MRKAVQDYRFIEDGTVLLAGISGGKDSAALLQVIPLGRIYAGSLGQNYYIRRARIDEMIFDIRK